NRGCRCEDAETNRSKVRTPPVMSASRASGRAPVLGRDFGPALPARSDRVAALAMTRFDIRAARAGVPAGMAARLAQPVLRVGEPAFDDARGGGVGKIGRASCRERV